VPFCMRVWRTIGRGHRPAARARPTTAARRRHATGMTIATIAGLTPGTATTIGATIAALRRRVTPMNPRRFHRVGRSRAIGTTTAHPPRVTLTTGAAATRRTAPAAEVGDTRPSHCPHRLRTTGTTTADGRNPVAALATIGMTTTVPLWREDLHRPLAGAAPRTRRTDTTPTRWNISRRRGRVIRTITLGTGFLSAHPPSAGRHWTIIRHATGTTVLLAAKMTTLANLLGEHLPLGTTTENMPISRPASKYAFLPSTSQPHYYL